MIVQVVERDFTVKGRMKPVSREQARTLNGRLPFYSVDTKEEADALVALALERGEFLEQADGSIVESTLAQEQTLDNLRLAGKRLAALHEELKAAWIT